VKLNIVLFQMNVIFGEPESNFQTINNFVEQTFIEENSILMLPELFLTGYHKDSLNVTAFSENQGYYLDKLKDISDKKKIAIYGSICEINGEDFYNTAVFIKPNGEVTSYRKSHLFGPMGEKDLFIHGREIVYVNFLDIKFGLSICYDLRFPRLYQKQRDAGVKIHLICAEWPNSRIIHWKKLLSARAIENQNYVIALNRVGKDPNYTYGGNSGIYSPFGETLIDIDNDLVGSAQFKIDINKIDEFRNLFNTSNDDWI